MELRDAVVTPCKSDLTLIGFSLDDCHVETDQESAKYLPVVHRTALEISIQNHFGTDIGGFWLMAEQIAELRKLPEYYPATEATKVAKTVEAYLTAQIWSAPAKRSDDGALG